MVMSFNMERRNAMIDALIENDIGIIREDDNWLLSQILLSGFKGYESFTDDELVDEMNERDLWNDWFEDQA
jgi:hypothetical protein